MEKINVSDNRFSTDITIPCYDTDASFRLKPAAFMDHAQEMAYLAAQALHFGYDDLRGITRPGCCQGCGWIS